MGIDYKALFDQGVDRRGSHCIKWDGRYEIFGNADVVPMWVADTDFAAPPDVVEALCRRAKHGAFGYSDHEGGDMAAARDWLRDRLGLAGAESEWLLYCPGVVDALYVAILTLTEKDDLVAIQPPVYGPFRMCTEKAGRRVYENNLVRTEDGKWRMDLDNLEEGLKQGVKAFILCSPHNPVGRVWTREELTDLVALLNRYGAKLLSDEIHCDIVFPGYKHTPILAVPGADNAVMAFAPSKTFNLAGLTHSFFACKDDKTRALVDKKLKELGVGGCNVFGELATEVAYRKGGAWADAQNEYLFENKNAARAFFREHMPEVDVTDSEGTFLLWADFRKWGLGEKDLIALLVKNGAGLSSGTFFGSAYDGFMRINIGTTRRNLMEGLANIEKAAKEIRG